MFRTKKPSREQKNSLRKMIEDDYKSLSKGTISPQFAFKLYSIFRVMHKFDQPNKVGTSISNFYDTLKDQYPEIAEFLRDNNR